LGRSFALAACVILALALAASTGLAMDAVSIHLKWLHGAQFAGLYAAEENGIFQAAGLDVTLIEGTAAEDVLLAAASGEYDFALADPSRHMLLVNQGVPNVAVSAVFQIDPLVVFSLADRRILTPRDLVGKRIMSLPTSYVIPAVLYRVGLTEGDVEIGPPSYDLGDLYAGVYDAWTGYLTNEVRLARADGHDVNVIYPTDYGVHFYGDVLITRRELVEETPDLVQRVVGALLDGWMWVLGHPNEAALLGLNWNPSLSPEDETEFLYLSLPFIHAGEVQLGAMTEEKWAGMAETMVAVGLLPEAFDPSDAYTREFVQAYYAPVQ
jgi:NitT/TauT family transport system substrate-binding protein